MTVENQFPRQDYTANGTDSHFVLSFYVEDKTNFIVKLDEIPVSNTDYIYDNLTNTVKFNEAPLVGQIITVERNTSLDRAINYSTYNNTFRPETLNFDFDRIWRKLQELGVVDWILQNNIDGLKGYVDTQDSELQNNIDGLKSYVDQKDNELRNYLIQEIQKQGIALNQLENYYNYLLQRLAQIAVDKGWDSSFIVDGNKTQKEINDLLAHEYYVENWRC